MLLYIRVFGYFHNKKIRHVKRVTTMKNIYLAPRE